MTSGGASGAFVDDGLHGSMQLRPSADVPRPQSCPRSLGSFLINRRPSKNSVLGSCLLSSAFVSTDCDNNSGQMPREVTIQRGAGMTNFTLRAITKLETAGGERRGPTAHCSVLWDTAHW